MWVAVGVCVLETCKVLRCMALTIAIVQRRNKFNVRSLYLVPCEPVFLSLGTLQYSTPQAASFKNCRE